MKTLLALAIAASSSIALADSKECTFTCTYKKGRLRHEEVVLTVIGETAADSLVEAQRICGNEFSGKIRSADVQLYVCELSI